MERRSRSQSRSFTSLRKSVARQHPKRQITRYADALPFGMLGLRS